jgi:putative proteasome-type protease
VIGEQVRRVSDLDRDALERDKYNFNVNFLLGGQVKGEAPNLMLVYPQGNPLQATEDSPYLQIGETKYGRPILDRGIKFDRTTLEEAAKYALLSMDSTMKSNVTVGPPVDLLAYAIDELDILRHRRFREDDPDLAKIRLRWEQALRQGILRLPNLRFSSRAGAGQQPQPETIQLVENPVSEADSGGGGAPPTRSHIANGAAKEGQPEDATAPPRRGRRNPLPKRK